MAEITLILGGCRSGKSRYALEHAEARGERRKIFLATCQAFDPEMENRIAAHQRERGPGWVTVEEPVDLPGALQRESRDSSLIVLDCLTLWVSNLLQEGRSEERIMEGFQELAEALRDAAGNILVVSNEVGQGIVPDNPMSRQFRDLVGWLNQRIAATADRVVWTVAGIPVTVKG
ncbi:bifunctional adenosylcobinamide kinase/adenosylcobinamide-phosphate guanylyltransferase [Desulfovermiculus halophilus]|uniref:bifunctional adenosylcobinamide kinase/adenosylcobinamide-phosphate guanylyltransferase n=1 Tax=Desulfovermiculus halophilus TaxID=339722 RepID=UPI00054D9EE6|nr:bifunctional adenosylcobinamide kinase/adenosylcobinamide-phosphate guanylyltransferase [Desulfovermiculus halophilus]